MYLDTQLCYLPNEHNSTSQQIIRSLESVINTAQCFAACVDEVRERERE